MRTSKEINQTIAQCWNSIQTSVTIIHNNWVIWQASANPKSAVVVRQ
jgi:hypothetical protein